MEKQPKHGALHGAHELQDVTLLEDTTKLIEVAERHNYSARALRKQLEAMQDESGYIPDDGSRLRHKNTVELTRDVEKQKKESRLRKFGKKLIAVAGLTAAGFGLTGGASNASQEKAPSEQSQESVSTTQYFEQIILSQQKVETEAEHEKEAAEWPVEFQSDLEGKRYENNFGPAYEGEMTQKAMVSDILDRAQKDPAFLAAMTASCGVIEQGDVDKCTAEYLADFDSRVAAYENLKTVLEDENTDVSYYVSEATFNSTYFKGTFERTVGGKVVTGPAIGYSTNLKVPESAPDAQKYVVSVENASLSLSMELRPDCGWQYNIVDEVEMAGVPQVTHQLQKEAPKTYSAVTPKVDSPYTIPVEMMKEAHITPERAFIPRAEVEQSTPKTSKTPEITPEVLKTPEVTPETPKVQEDIEITPEVTPETTPLEEVETPELPPIGEANPPRVELPPVEVTPHELPPIGEANPPKVTLPPKEVTPVEPEVVEEPKTPEEPNTPDAPKMPPVEITPEVDDSKDWGKSKDKSDGINPDDVEVNTNKNNSLTKDPKEEGNGTKHKNIDGKGQDPQKEVEIKAPNVEQPKPKVEKKKETKDDSPIYTELKNEYKKREVEKKLEERNAQINETKESERKAKEFQEQQRKQQETDAKAREIEKKMADKEQAEIEYREYVERMQEKQRQKDAQAKRDAEAKAIQDAEAKAKQEAATPKVNATPPTEVTENN